MSTMKASYQFDSICWQWPNTLRLLATQRTRLLRVPRTGVEWSGREPAPPRSPRGYFRRRHSDPRHHRSGLLGAGQAGNALLLGGWLLRAVPGTEISSWEDASLS